MNKLYSAITKSLYFLLLLGVGGALKAQTLTNANITVNTSRPWSVLEPGISTCNACTITITGTAVLTIDKPVTFGSTTPANGGSTINVTNSSQLDIAANVTLSNTQVVIGDPSASNTDIAPGTANLFVANGATLTLSDNISAIRLANLNNYIEAGAGGSGLAPGQIVYSSGSTTVSLFSGSTAVNNRNLNIGTPYSANPAKVTGPAISSVLTKAGITLASFGTTFTILPITLVDFAASLNSNGSVGLSWTTDQEENSSYFNIQRSVNGNTWTNIGKVAAQGNSSVATNYSFTDPSPVSGADYYRLQATDLDGSYTYSPVQVIRTTSQSAGFSIFPNPATDIVNVSLTAAVSDATIRLIDISGKVLLEQKVSNAGGTIVSLPVQSFTRGTYIVVVRTPDGTQYTGKVLVTH